MRPLVRPGAIVGMFLGDEVCCHNSTCLSATVEPVAARLRLHYPNASELFLWTNECGDSLIGLPTVPPSLDIISVDTYDGFLPGNDGADEVRRLASLLRKDIYPRLLPHQRAMVVPGFFGCDNTTSCGSLASQEARLVQKMEAYGAFLRNESRLVGLAPWHYTNRGHSQNDKSPCDMRLGAVAFPGLMQRWTAFGEEIVRAKQRE